MNVDKNRNTPAESAAQTLRAEYDLSNHGIAGARVVYWNLPTEALYEEAAYRGEGAVTKGGPFVAHTGKHTGRSANDKFFVKNAESEQALWWGGNRSFDAAKFDALYDRMKTSIQGNDVFVQDVYAGADPNYRLKVRFVTEEAWHSMFVRNMFIAPETLEEIKSFTPDFTIVDLPSFKADPASDETRSETFVILNLERKLGIIGNTRYAGEMKKSIFTLLNYLLPLRGVMSMHCSANVNPTDRDDVALFFGLSGTGKTTLSADPTRSLIGDDEHGWSDDGVFNYEGGCYAKVIGLSQEAEPEIYATTHTFG
ncbi:MAG: phosphoenolpyruvate carboxykinase (ATP), partial [Anaerolineales bacterium]|nr:phosphoenolpyruvate carboxykinase (ATP) [Anaerolineales bacterium]